MKNIQNFIKTTKLLQIAAMAVLFVMTGCASIVSKSNWPVSFKSNPPGAEVVVTDNMGNEVDRGTTPVIFTLKSSDGFFSGATYYAEFKLNDYQVSKKGIHADVNGWYFGNIFFGGFIGLVVDPLTGAMWKLQPICSVELNKAESLSVKQ
jgi:hypothetical protein